MPHTLDFEHPIHAIQQKIDELKSLADKHALDLSSEIKSLTNKLETEKRSIYTHLTPWQKVKMARHITRPTTKDYIHHMVDDFLELHGDRSFRDDPSIIGGIGTINHIPMTIIGHQKGKNTKENIMRNFGMSHPEGYRKTLRLMKQAEKFKRPIVLFVDTPGAYCGMEAEKRGQSQSIAQNLLQMSTLKTPILVIVIGEGGSGGALGLGVGDKIAMLEHAVYSVISPEGLATILWKDPSLSQKAANGMKMTSKDLLDLHVIDHIIKEPIGGAHKDVSFVSRSIKEYILKEMPTLLKMDTDTLLNHRYLKFRNMGTNYTVSL